MPVVGWAQQGLACCTTGSDEPRRPTGSVGAVRHGWCVACRVKLGRRRTPGCWHREAWLCLSWDGHSKGWPAAPPAATAATSRGGPPAASGRFGTGGVWRAGLSWAGGAHLVAGTGRPGCACRGMGTARAGLLHHRQRRCGDEPRRPTGSVGAVRHGWCVACRVKLGRRRTPGCWHREAWLCLSWGGHSKGWPAAPPAATSRGGPPAASGRFGTGGVWRAGLSWAGGAHLVAGTGRPGCACRGLGTARAGLLHHRQRRARRPTGSVGAVRHGWCVACRVKLGRRRTPGCWHREAWLCLSWGGHSKGWPAAPPAATAATSRGGPPAASGRCGTGGVWRAGLSWAGGAHLVAGTGRPGCACRGLGTARAGLLHHRQRRAAAAHRQRRGGSARVVCGVQG